MTRPALFLDRDGTLITDTGYPRDPALVALLPDVVPPLRAAIAAGWALVIISNQSGVAQGLITPAEAVSVQERVEALFAAHRIVFDAAKFCFHGADDGCACRKPEPGMILASASELDIDLERSVMIGDKLSDVEAGRAAGCRTIAFGNVAAPDADAHCATWAELATWLAGPNGLLGVAG